MLNNKKFKRLKEKTIELTENFFINTTTKYYKAKINNKIEKTYIKEVELLDKNRKTLYYITGKLIDAGDLVLFISSKKEDRIIQKVKVLDIVNDKILKFDLAKCLNIEELLSLVEKISEEDYILKTESNKKQKEKYVIYNTKKQKIVLEDIDNYKIVNSKDNSIFKYLPKNIIFEKEGMVGLIKSDEKQIKIYNNVASVERKEDFENYLLNCSTKKDVK